MNWAGDLRVDPALDRAERPVEDPAEDPAGRRSRTGSRASPPRPWASVPSAARGPEAAAVPSTTTNRRTPSTNIGLPCGRRRPARAACIGRSAADALTGRRLRPGADRADVKVTYVTGRRRAGARIASASRQDGARWRHVTPVLDKTDLFGTLPPELLEQLRDRTALARLRRGDVIFEKGDPATSLYVVFSGRVAIVGQGGRRPRVGDLGARPGRAVRRDVDVRRRRALGATPARSRPRTSSRSTFDDVREVLVAPARRAVGGRAHPRPPPARDRRGARRRDVPRRHRPHRQAPARAGRRRRRLPHAAHARGAGRHGRRVARARQQGDRVVREARLARDLGPQPLPHPRPRRARSPRAIS